MKKYIALNALISLVSGAIGGTLVNFAKSNTQIQQYIMDHPEVLINSVEQHYKSQMQLQVENIVQENHDALFKDPNSPVIGNQDAKHTIVEFFDYNCGYCQKMGIVKDKLLSENVKIIEKELPVLGEQSMLKARYSVAIHKMNPGLYKDVNKELLHQKINNEEELLKLLQKYDLDMEKLKEIAGSEEVTNVLKKNHDLASKLRIQGTPGYVVGTKIIPGYADYEAFKKLLDEQQE